jgi:hypothetical protein
LVDRCRPAEGQTIDIRKAKFDQGASETPLTILFAVCTAKDRQSVIDLTIERAPGCDVQK